MLNVLHVSGFDQGMIVLFILSFPISIHPNNTQSPLNLSSSSLLFLYFLAISSSKQSVKKKILECKKLYPKFPPRFIIHTSIKQQ